MDLESQYPDYLKFRQYIGGYSHHKNQEVYTVSKTGSNDVGRPMPRSISAADHLAPGHYPVDRDFPNASRFEEIGVGWLTRSAKCRNVAFPYEDREQAFYRSCCPAIKNPGPPHYFEASIGAQQGSRGHEFVSQKWTIPKVNQTGGRPMPRSVSAADHLGPGTYKLNNRCTDLSWRKVQKLEKCAKAQGGKDHWAGNQYSHIFTRIKPGPKSVSKAASTGSLGAH
eukprot:TRINITY_DN35471_c0_g1_i1.p1 TRINITY_DN35471_c0_g1~~TRINITY_DN35471_c0_g1_i1.p1  ORF type:complete len:225 (-),score=20.48 TRINITY_DN35471_c0_g1_i1:155-829(-)